MKATEPIESRNTDHYDPQQAKDLTPAGTQDLHTTLPSEFNGMSVDDLPSNFFICSVLPLRRGATQKM